MRFTLTLESAEPEFSVPLHYNASIQAALYSLLPDDFSSFLHDTGFVYEKRTFRMFTFSRLIGEYLLKKEEGRIYFRSPVRLIVSSPLRPFCEAILASLLGEKKLRIGGALFRVTGVNSQQNDVSSDKVRVRTLSPVTIYSTMYRGDGSRFTVYFHPRDKDFAKLVQENMRKKTELLHGGDTPFHFQLSVDGKTRKHMIYYKKTVIEGYSGTFYLRGTPQVLQTALDVGLGAKNSQGFGCLQLV